MNLEMLQRFGNFIANFITLDFLVGVLAIGLFYGSRFNTWTDNEAKYGKSRPPRQFTTWARFMTYGFVYIMTAQLLYMLFILTPDLLALIRQVSETNGKQWLPKDEGPLWVMVFMLGFFPHLPWLSKIEANYRNWLHQQAFIPSEARALIQQLLSNPGFFKPDESTKQKVNQKFSTDMPITLSQQRSGDPMASKWFRIAFLMEKINLGRAVPQIERYFNRCKDDYHLLQEQFRKQSIDVETYKEEISKYTKNQDKDGERLNERAEYLLEHHQINILHQLDHLIDDLYELIVCGVLSTERVHSRRIAKLNSFALHPAYVPGIPVDLDIVLKNAVIAFIITAITSTFYLLYRKNFEGREIHLALGLVWAVIALLAIGLCILAAVLVYRQLSRKGRFKPTPNNYSVLSGPIVHQCIGFLTGYFVGFLVIFAYMVMGTQRGPWYSLVRALPWPLIPATTAGFIVYYLAKLSDVRKPLHNAVLQGAVTGIAGIVAVIWAFENIYDRYASVVYIITTCVGIGTAIGYTFPKSYQKRMATVYLGPERRHHYRMVIVLQSVLKHSMGAICCEVVNISAGGASFNAPVNFEIGDTVQLELSGVGKIMGRVVCKRQHQTGVAFETDERGVASLRDYLGGLAWSSA